MYVCVFVTYITLDHKNWFQKKYDMENIPLNGLLSDSEEKRNTKQLRLRWSSDTSADKTTDKSRDKSTDKTGEFSHYYFINFLIEKATVC